MINDYLFDNFAAFKSNIYFGVALSRVFSLEYDDLFKNVSAFFSLRHLLDVVFNQHA